MKKILLLVIICLVFSGCTWFKKKNNNETVFIDTSNPTFTVSSSPTPSVANSNVSLPTDEDIIRNFFALINEDRISEAVLSLHPDMISDETTKQTWGVNFNTIDNSNIISIEKSDQSNWPTDEHIYKVIVSIKLRDGAQYMGWDDGENIKWFHLTQDGKLWKISEIATGY